MTNKLVVIINSPKVRKIKKILLYEMKFLVPHYSCLQKPWLGGYCLQIPVLSVLCPQRNLLNSPPPKQNSLVCQCPGLYRYCFTFSCYLSMYCVVRTIKKLRRCTQPAAVYSLTEMLSHCVTIPLEFKCLHCKCWIKKQSELPYLLLVKV